MSYSHQWEREWWGGCFNTLGEEMKQLTYAKKMGFQFFHDGKSPYNIDMEGKSVLDIGGGPVSLLLKCVNVRGTVIDPCEYPDWVMRRYEAAGIRYITARGEDVEFSHLFDCALIYNTLQHTDDPELIIRNAKKSAQVIRIFEWIDIPPCAGHPHMLTEEKLNEWLGGDGKVEWIDENTATGKCYYGVFRGAV